MDDPVAVAHKIGADGGDAAPSAAPPCFSDRNARAHSEFLSLA